MTYIVTENCIKCKFMDCVEVCPVDCFYEGENMLVIHPDECIDCGEINVKYSADWPNITTKRESPADAEDWKDRPGKKAEFSTSPGLGG